MRASHTIVGGIQERMGLSRKLLLWLALNSCLLLLAGKVLPLAAQQPSARKDAPALTREQTLRRDARRLVELSKGLHKEIAESNENVLSLAILRKAEEVERLARELREQARK